MPFNKGFARSFKIGVATKHRFRVKFESQLWRIKLEMQSNTVVDAAMNRKNSAHLWGLGMDLFLRYESQCFRLAQTISSLFPRLPSDKVTSASACGRKHRGVVRLPTAS